MSPRAPRADPVLLAEVVLVLLLFGLFLALYLVPAALPPFLPYWWSWPVIAALLFGLVALDAWRRRRHRRVRREELEAD